MTRPSAVEPASSGIPGPTPNAFDKQISQFFIENDERPKDRTNPDSRTIRKQPKSEE